MIKRIRIKNFKAFRDTNDIEIKPITILMGINSSGKSSIIQALLALRQTMVSRDTEVPLQVVGDYVDLGSYVDCVFNHKVAAKDETFLSFEFSIIPKHSLWYTASKYRLSAELVKHLTKKVEYDDFHVATSFGYNKKARKIYLREFNLKDAANTLIISVITNAAGQVIQLKSDILTKLSDLKARHKSVLKSLKRSKFFYEFLPRFKYIGGREEGVKDYAEDRQLSAFISSCYDATQRDFSRVFYLGPLRRKTRRFSPITGETPQDVGFEGENALKLIYKDFKSSMKQKKNLVERVKSWLIKFDVASELSVVTFPGYQFALNIIDPHNKSIVNLSDVGFGVSQVLPLIVEGFYSPLDSMILIEQPEIHLHPALQSHLGDLLIDISKEGKTIVVETHSEHLILRLQRKIASGELSKDDVAIYFVEPGGEGSSVKRITLNEYGQFLNWPEGFFEEDIKERIEHLVQMDKKMNGISDE